MECNAFTITMHGHVDMYMTPFTLSSRSFHSFPLYIRPRKCPLLHAVELY